jgi:hypothetical protein
MAKLTFRQFCESGVGLTKKPYIKYNDDECAYVVHDKNGKVVDTFWHTPRDNSDKKSEYTKASTLLTSLKE